MKSHQFFAENYADARTRFLDAAGNEEFTLEAYACPARGPDGETLFTDVASLGKHSDEAILVATSGTHGVEGFCGSGILVGLLQSGLARSWATDATVLLVHAINPYGFAHERRVNEDNVDLNRNFVSHGGPYPENPGYDELHAHLVPKDWNGAVRDHAERGIAAFIESCGHAAYQAAVTGGQYRHSDGLFYGGQSAVWSNRTWRQILAAHLKGRRRIAHIDLHTGLGPRGYGELQYEGHSSDAAFVRAQAWYAGEATAPDDGSSSSSSIEGFMANALFDAAPQAQITSISLEYGTRPLDQVLDAVRADNWLHVHGKVDSAQGRAIKAATRDAFYGEDMAWKHDVWERAEEIFSKAVRGLASG